MIKIILYFTLSLNILYGYDYFATDEEHLSIYDTKIYKAQSDIPIESILKQYANDRFTALKGKSYAKGFYKGTYWISFKIKSKNNPNLFIASKHLIVDTMELYKFKNKKLISHTISKKDINYFDLGEKFEGITYFIKYKTDSPIFIAFEVMQEKYLYRNLNDQFYLGLFLFGVALALIVSNIFLYISTRKSIYIYYSLMSLSFLLFNLFIRFGSLYIDITFYTQYKFFIMGFLISSSIMFLYLFSSTFLDISKKYPKTDTYLKITAIVFVSIIAIILMLNLVVEKVFAVLLILYTFITLCVAIKNYFDGNKLAKYYLIATGVHLLSYISIPLLLTGVIEYTLLTYNILFFGLIWDILFLSLAIGFRINVLEKNELLVETAMTRSRQATFGTMIDTISHQWKQPLNELGLQMMHIDTQLKLNNKVPSYEMLEKTVKKSNNILEFMSTTIDIFRNFFKSSENISEVDISQTIKNTILFLESTFEIDNIMITKEIEPNIMILGLEEEFAHSVLNILVNAKDIFKQRGIEDSHIKITLKAQNNQAIITIQDNAGGIILEPVEKIFQSDVSTKKNGGIGLYITYKIITQKLGGKISVNNTDNGAIFLISIPTGLQ